MTHCVPSSSVVEEIERKFIWSAALMRDYAVWESETSRYRKITEWHARQIADRLCLVFGISREEFASQASHRLIEDMGVRYPEPYRRRRNGCR